MIKRFLISIFTLLVLGLLIFTSFLLGTHSGLQWAYRMAKPYIPGNINISQLQGTLTSRIIINHLDYHAPDDAFSVKADQIALSWLPINLLHGQIRFNHLTAQNLHIYLNNQNKHAKHLQDESSHKTIAVIKKPSSLATKVDQNNRLSEQTSTLPLPFSFSFYKSDFKNIHIITDKNKKPIDIDQLAFTLKLNNNKLHISHLTMTQKNKTLKLNGTITTAPPYPLFVKITAAFLKNNKTTYQLNGIFKGDLNHLKATVTHKAPFPATLTAELNTLLTQPSWVGKITWPNWTYPLADQQITLKAGEISSTGNLKHYAFTAQTGLVIDNEEPIRLSSIGSGNFSELTITKLALENTQLNLLGNGKITREPKLNSHLRLTGKIHNTPMQFSASTDYINNIFTAQAQAKLETGKIEFEAIQQNGWSVQWNILLPTLENLFSGLSGYLKSKGKLQLFQDNSLFVDGNLLLKKARFLHSYVDSFSADLNWNNQPQQISHIQLIANKIAYGSLHLDSLSLRAKGTVKEHTIETTAISGKNTLSTHLIGQWDQNTWKKNLSSVQIRNTVFGDWQLKQPVSLSISPHSFSMTPFVWQSTGSKIIFALNKSEKQKFSASLHITNFDLSRLQQLFPDKFFINGNLNVIADFNYSDQSQSSQLNLTVSPGKIRYMTDYLIHEIPHQGGTLSAVLSPSTLSGDLNFIIDKNHSINGKITFPHFQIHSASLKDQTFNGNLTVKLAQLDWLPLLIPQLSNTTGNGSAALEFSGSLTAPKISGIIDFSNGKTSIPDLGIDLTHIQAKLITDRMNTLHLFAQVKNNDVPLTLTGNLTSLSKVPQSHFTLKGDNFLISNTHTLKMYVSPNLVLDTKGKEAFLTGTVIIPKANIKPDDTKSAVALSSDVVFVTDTQQKVTPNYFMLKSRIKLLLGEKVNLQYHGLIGRLAGELNINYQPGQFITADGEIRVENGEYQAYGQLLKITKGRLNYAGSLIVNPGLTIRAERTISTTSQSTITALSSVIADKPKQLPANLQSFIVGVTIGGTAKKPVISLFSEPAVLSQSDILSYLVVGRSTSQASGGDTALLLQAASALGGTENTAANLLQELRNKLSIDEISFQTETIEPSDDDDEEVTDDNGEPKQNTSLVLGKKISSRLYIKTSFGLLEPISSIRLIYKLSPKWSIQTETGTKESGVDLLYSIERD